MNAAANGGHNAPGVVWRWLNANADALFAKLGGMGPKHQTHHLPH